MSFDCWGKGWANLGSILGRVEALRQTCSHKVCSDRWKKSFASNPKPLISVDSSGSDATGKNTLLAVTSWTLINKRRLLIKQGSYEAEEVGPLETRRSLNVAYFFSPFLQATRLRTTGRRHALNAFYTRLETQIAVAISYRDERVISFPFSFAS